MARQDVYLDRMIHNQEGTKMLDIALTWLDWHGADNHRECTVCELAAWLNGCIVFGMHPQPFQGIGDDSDTYKGQPIVYDGVWECIDGALWFVGADGCGGGTKAVQRKMLENDRVIFY
jgi:hypothetical protein